MTHAQSHPAIFRTGDPIWITCDGRTVEGHIVIASANGKSMVLEFEAILAGHAGWMPVARTNKGGYRSLFGRHEVSIWART